MAATQVELRAAERTAQASLSAAAAATRIQSAFFRHRARLEFNSRTVSGARIRRLLQAAHARNRGVLLLALHLSFMVCFFVLQARAANVPELHMTQKAAAKRFEMIEGEEGTLYDLSTTGGIMEWVSAALDELHDVNVAEQTTTAGEVRGELGTYCGLIGTAVADSCDTDHATFQALKLYTEASNGSYACPMVEGLTYVTTGIPSVGCRQSTFEVCDCDIDNLDAACFAALDDLCSTYPGALEDLCTCVWFGEGGLESCSELVGQAKTQLQAGGHCQQCSDTHEHALFNSANRYLGFATLSQRRFAQDEDTGELSGYSERGPLTGSRSGKMYPTLDLDDFPYVFPLDIGVFGYTDTSLCLLDLIEADDWLDTSTAEVRLAVRTQDATLDLVTRTTATVTMDWGGGWTADITAHALSTRDLRDDAGFVALYAVVWIMVGVLVAEQAWELWRLHGPRRYLSRWWSLLHLGSACVYAATLALMALNNDERAAYRPVTISTLSPDLVQTAMDDGVALDGFVDDDITFRSLVSGAMLCAVLQIIERCRFHRQVSLVTRTLAQARSDLVHFGIFFVLIIVSFAALCMQLLGHTMDEFASLYAATETLLFLTLGEVDAVDYDTVVDVAPLLGPLIVWLYLVLATILLLNVALSIIVDAFAKVNGGPAAAAAEPLHVSFSLAVRHWWRRLRRVVKRRRVSVLPDTELGEAVRDIAVYASSSGDVGGGAAADDAARVKLTRAARSALRRYGVSSVAIGHLMKTAESTVRVPEAPTGEQRMYERVMRRLDALSAVGPPGVGAGVGVGAGAEAGARVGAMAVQDL